MIKWEYERIDLNILARSETDIDVLNNAGAKGWELVSINNCNIAILKRAVSVPTTRATKTAAAAASTAPPAASGSSAASRTK